MSYMDCFDKHAGLRPESTTTPACPPTKRHKTYSSQRTVSNQTSVSVPDDRKVLLEIWGEDDKEFVNVTTTVADPAELMGLLCEAICTVIHGAHMADQKEDYESVRDCQRHIEKGFADASYHVNMNVEEETDANASTT